MTPKEQADELITEFSPLVTTWDCYWDKPEDPKNILADAKKCAIIAVKKIIDVLDKNFGINVSIKKEYWQEVLTELEKL